MRLFHVSEDPDIQVFKPRIPKRKDLDQNTGLVWAIDDEHLFSFLVPRDCPRAAYYLGKGTSENDRKRFFSSSSVTKGMVIENIWFQRILNAKLYLYEFDCQNFMLQDQIAGYHVSTKTEYPLQRFVLTDLFDELIKRNVEIRITDNLSKVADALKTSTLNWSLCKMKNATTHIK